MVIDKVKIKRFISFIFKLNTLFIWINMYNTTPLITAAWRVTSCKYNNKKILIISAFLFSFNLVNNLDMIFAIKVTCIPLTENKWDNPLFWYDFDISFGTYELSPINKIFKYGLLLKRLSIFCFIK